MTQQIPLTERSEIGRPLPSADLIEVLPDLAFRRLYLVNAIFIGEPGGASSGWTLIDAGVRGSVEMIKEAARERFPEAPKPNRIVLTHGHFDHVGALHELLNEWDVPVFAHELEIPYLNGSTAYPPPDPSVGGGLVATLSRFFPNEPIDVSPWLRALPADGSVPGLPEWRWIHTPGHTPGHISLWRERDRTIVAGDAFITTAQESAYAVISQSAQMHGPPRYFTPDWVSAGESVRKLAALAPETVITGHGRAMAGAEMRSALQRLAERFEEIAVPENERVSRFHLT